MLAAAELSSVQPQVTKRPDAFRHRLQISLTSQTHATTSSIFEAAVEAPSAPRPRRGAGARSFPALQAIRMIAIASRLRKDSIIVNWKGQGSGDSLVVKALCYKSQGRGFKTP
jgi:hypothetical protein